MQDEPRLKWGRALQRALEDMLPAERPLFLQHLEQTGRAEGNLEKLRAVKEYKTLASFPISTPKPPTD